MNRELKFRAWSSRMKTMSYPLTLSAIIERRPQFCEPNDPVMQYTGVKDKNGVEIYEGDIVESYNQLCVVTFNGDNFGGVIGWNLILPNEEAKEYYYGESPSNRNEIVGNIYDNSDLWE